MIAYCRGRLNRRSLERSEKKGIVSSESRESRWFSAEFPPAAHHDPCRPSKASTRYLLTIGDLASGYTLAWLPVREATAETVQGVLHNLFRIFGAPLVFKSDNGSHFRADFLRAFLPLLASNNCSNRPITLATMVPLKPPSLL